MVTRCRRDKIGNLDLDVEGAPWLLELHPEHPGLAAGGGQGGQGGGLHVPLAQLPHQIRPVHENCSAVLGADLTSDDDLEQPVDASRPHSLHGQVGNSSQTPQKYYIFRDKYAIQLWTDASNPSDLTIKTVAEKGFKMIFSNHDATYLDCGFGAWV